MRHAEREVWKAENNTVIKSYDSDVIISALFIYQFLGLPLWVNYKNIVVKLTDCNQRVLMFTWCENDEPEKASDIPLYDMLTVSHIHVYNWLVSKSSAVFHLIQMFL